MEQFNTKRKKEIVQDIYKGLKMRCKYIKKCKLYDKDSHVCNKTGGMYYENETQPAGCYRRLDCLK